MFPTYFKTNSHAEIFIDEKTFENLIFTSLNIRNFNYNY